MIAYLLDWAHKSIKSHLKTREILFNFKRKSIVEQVIMNTENSRKAFLQEIDFEVGDSVLLTSWITKLPNIRIRSFKKEKPMKDTKGERQEINSIQAEIIKKDCIIVSLKWKKNQDTKQIILHKREDKSYIWVHYQSNIDFIKEFC